MTQDFELRSISVKLDGKESIEHQLDIHVIDLVESIHNPDIELADVLAGIQYVLEYRIAGGKMASLNYEIMSRLMEGLLANMSKRTGGLLKKKFTPEAQMSFVLFGHFLEEVEEFRQAVNKQSASDLQYSFALHKRLDSEQEETTASFLSVVLHRCYQISDWRELVNESDHDKIEDLMSKYEDKFKDPGMLTQTVKPFPPQSLYFDKNSEKLASMFSSSIVTGLPQSFVQKHRDYYGSNKIPEPPKISIGRMILGQFTDFMIILLMVVAIVDFFTDEVPSGVALMLVVVLNASIGFTQELKAKKALDALSSLSVPQAKVIRDGQTTIVDASELVPGDLVSLDEGDIVPADMRLCEISQLEVMEVILTGESLGVPKSTRTIRKRTRKLPLGDCKGNVFMATVVARGRGKGIVVRVGNCSEIGRISQAISATPHEKTILEKRLNTLGKILVALAVTMCLIIIFISLGYRRDLRATILLGVSLAVSVIPESLVAVVTVAMALGVKRMAAQNAIVKKLPAVESLGSVGVICSDKTGTLTEGKMGASTLWTSDDKSYVFTESTNIDPEMGAINQQKGSELLLMNKNPCSYSSNLMASMMAASLCNNSSIIRDPDAPSKWKTVGDPTEIAMLVAGRKAGISKEWLQDSLGLEKIGEFAFDSDRKLMSVIYEQKPKVNNDKAFPSGSTFILAKGAPEGILKNCTGYLPHMSNYKDFCTASHVPLRDDVIEKISKESSSMAKLGLRVLAFAIRMVTPFEASEIINSNKSSMSETNLTFVGLIGLIDPPKQGVKKSVELCHAAGIKVIMITGDHISTAVAIAKQLSIIQETDEESDVAMKGYEVDLLSEDNLAAMKPFPRVFARVSPDNKLKIIKALQKRGEAVSMTGDGVNDAPAIKKADVGVAMGISGTEITKQAADIVLSDDNFTTIVTAVKEGRLVFDNIRKFCSYILTCSASEVFLFLATAIINSGEPFGKLSILYANIIADVPPAISLGLEPAESDIMERKPRPVEEHVMTTKISILVLIQGLVISLISLAVFLLSKTYSTFGQDIESEHQSLTFGVLVTGHLIQSFLSKSVYNSIFVTGVTNNKWMVIAFFVSLALLVIGIEAPTIQTWLGLTSIGGIGWAVIFISAIIHLIIIEMMKLIFRRLP